VFRQARVEKIAGYVVDESWIKESYFLIFSLCVAVKPTHFDTVDNNTSCVLVKGKTNML